MAGDLPPGKWSSVLVGPWWPSAPTGLHDSQRHWSEMSSQQEQFAQGLHSTMTNLTRNKGLTADDLVGQYNHGSSFHLDLAEKYAAKSRAFGSAADAIDHLRSGLRSIADEYNKLIEEAEKSAHGNALSHALAVARIAELITEANAQAASKSASAVSALTSAMQSILTAESSSLSPRDFMQSQGIAPNDAKPPNAEAAAKNGMPKFGDGGDAGTTPTEAAGYHHDNGGVDTPRLGTGADGAAGPEGPHVSPAANVTNAGGDHVPAVPGGSIHAPGGGGAHIPGGGSVPGAGGLSPAALGNGLSPASLTKGFEAGAQAGQPAAAGAQSVAGSAMQAAAPPPAAAPQAPAVAPHAIPTHAASGEGEFASSSHAAAASSAPTVSSSDHYTAAPTVLAAPMSAPAAPVGGAPAVPAGPLPAYGSDLRPMTAAPPVTAAPAGPVAGAPVAASPASSPSAGGLVSPVERSTPAAAAAAQANASTAAGAGVAAATAGAVAGDAAKRVGAQRDLQSKVDAVARQEPAIAWAVGLLDDDTTTLLTTDLAGGWIPPHVKLPAGITLLAPSARRRDISAADLLGPVTVAAAYQPHGYIADPGPGDPVLSGERARHGQYVDELGPTLVSAMTRRPGLATTQFTAKAAVRGTGLLDHEVEQLRNELNALQREVIGAYPEHKPELLANWMLLSAVEAVADGHNDLAHYHLAWYLASLATTAG